MAFRRNKAQQWARLAMKAGLFLTDAKLWSAINEQMRERADDMGDTLRRTYRETTDRLDNAQAALRGEHHWFGSGLTFLGGVGLGIGIGMLLAPMSGEQARATIRDKAGDVRHRVSDFAGGGSRYRPVSSPTGTEGD